MYPEYTAAASIRASEGGERWNVWNPMRHFYSQCYNKSHISHVRELFDLNKCAFSSAFPGTCYIWRVILVSIVTTRSRGILTTAAVRPICVLIGQETWIHF